jgi:hypothetical protein
MASLDVRISKEKSQDERISCLFKSAGDSGVESLTLSSLRGLMLLFSKAVGWFGPGRCNEMVKTISHTCLPSLEGKKAYPRNQRVSFTLL